VAPVIVDSSTLIDSLLGRRVPPVEDAMAAAALVLAPLVIAEVLSGQLTLDQREVVGNLLQDYPLADTPLQHGMNVGSLRRTLRARGLNVTLPDAHVAQCALDLDATLLTHDEVFRQIAQHTPLRLR
jgi:predicted nucleic acid-binding protein